MVDWYPLIIGLDRLSSLIESNRYTLIDNTKSEQATYTYMHQPWPHKLSFLHDVSLVPKPGEILDNHNIFAFVHNSLDDQEYCSQAIEAFNLIQSSTEPSIIIHVSRISTPEKHDKSWSKSKKNLHKILSSSNISTIFIALVSSHEKKAWGTVEYRDKINGGFNKFAQYLTVQAPPISEYLVNNMLDFDFAHPGTRICVLQIHRALRKILPSLATNEILY